MKLGRRVVCESQARSLPTNPERVRGATLWAVGIERRASLVTTNTGCRASKAVAQGRTWSGKLTETASGPGGVVVTARREGLYRNWRSPPDPGEKPPGAR